MHEEADGAEQAAGTRETVVHWAAASEAAGVRQPTTSLWSLTITVISVHALVEAELGLPFLLEIDHRC